MGWSTWNLGVKEPKRSKRGKRGKMKVKTRRTN